MNRMETIYERHVSVLARFGLDQEAVRLSLRLALEEMAEGTGASDAAEELRRAHRAMEQMQNSIELGASAVAKQKAEIEALREELERRNRQAAAYDNTVQLVARMNTVTNGVLPAVKEAPAAPVNFPLTDGQGAARVPVREEENGMDEVLGVDWGVLGLTSLANQARLSLNGGETTWRKVPKTVRLELVQAVLIQDTGSGKAMTMGEFDRMRPAWMPKASSLPTTFGCAWDELPGLRLDV